VIYLGLNTVRALALSVGIFSQYEQKNCKLFSLDVLASHSWTTGVMSRSIAQQERMELKILEQCFLAGMLHDVGQLVLAFGLHDEYSEVLAKAKAENLQIWQVEQEAFGASHADVGAYLLALWGLPNPIIEAVAMHHQPSRCVAPEFSPTIAVHAADVFAHQCFAGNTEVPPPQLDLAYLTSLGFAERIETWQAGCKEELNN
jgi:HD-like signal output (HDOD) protein